MRHRRAKSSLASKGHARVGGASAERRCVAIGQAEKEKLTGIVRDGWKESTSLGSQGDFCSR